MYIYLRVKVKTSQRTDKILLLLLFWLYCAGDWICFIIKGQTAQAETGKWTLGRMRGIDNIVCGLELITYTLQLCGCLFVCLTDTHFGICLPLLPSLSFLSLLLAPLCSLCLCTQTNQSSFDLLEMSLASETHFECDEWVEGGGGLLEDTLEERDGQNGVSFSAEKVLSNSSAHYR